MTWTAPIIITAAAKVMTTRLRLRTEPIVTGEVDQGRNDSEQTPGIKALWQWPGLSHGLVQHLGLLTF